MTTTEPAAPVSCANPDCRVAETGKCVEGFAITVCPQYGRAVASESSAETSVASDATHLRSAEALTAGDAVKVLCSLDTRVIAIVGSFDAGKSSLIAGLYDKLQDGPIAEASFARSFSLHALDRLCHDARATSQRHTPHSPHTPQGEVLFYDIVFNKNGKHVGLLLADRSGEDYKSVGNNQTDPATLPELSRANTVAVLIDGRRLIDASQRHNQESELILVLRALGESNVLDQPRLAVVLTKLDLVLATPDPETGLKRFRDLANRIGALFPNLFSDVATFETAASPETDAAQRGQGIAELLSFWLASHPTEHLPISTPITGSRAFWNLSAPA